MRLNKLHGTLGFVVLLAACSSPTELPQWLPEGYELAVREDFTGPASLERFELSDPAAWRWSDGALELLGSSAYEPPHRSPTSFALLKGPTFGDFVLEVDLRQTGREYGHRDLCLFFGFEGPGRFYYVHLAPAPDDRAHNVFLVNDAPRRRIGEIQERGFVWGDGWHRLRLERSGDSVRVFVDGEIRPILEASDGTLSAGRIGFGSFDDQGMFSRLRVWAPTGRR